MDTTRQIEYWINTATDDIQTAELLIENKKILQGLFFCHLCIEKTLKAHVVNFTKDIPPKSHNLLSLIGKTNLEISDEDKDFCGILMSYQLEGRYPEYYPESPSKITALVYLSKTKTFHSWLKAKLSK